MSSYYTFDDLSENDAKYQRSKQPFWSLNLDDPNNEKAILRWLTGEINYLSKQSEDRVTEIRKHIALYKGVQYENQEVSRSRFNIKEQSDDKTKKVQKVVANHLYDLVEQRQARLIKYKPAVSILPTNDELQDKVAAKMVKMLLDTLWYKYDFESTIVPNVVKETFIKGEDYLFITWNPDIGDLHPDYDPNKKVPLLDENGKQKTDEAGKPIFIDQAVRVGDVSYEIVPPEQVFLDPKKQFEKVEYCFRRHIKHVDAVRRDYPEKAYAVKATQNYFEYDYDKMKEIPLDNEVVVWEFFHKSTKYLDKGRRIVFTPDVILENTELPYSHGELPFERLTDIDIPNEIFGRSFFINTKGLAAVYNNMINMIWRNQVLVSHPKWMMPAGAAKIESLGNDITVVQYKGPQPPVLVQSNPTPSEAFNFSATIKEELQQLSGVYGVSRGEPPAGIKAGVALQFLAEQETERNNSTIVKFNEFIKRVAIKTISVCGDYYDESDGRTVRIVGENNAWMLQFFDVSNLSKSYDVQIQNSSALPQSRAARTQYLMDIKEQYPEAISTEQFLDLLDLAQSEKFIDIVTAAVKTAEAECEKLLQGKQVPPPEEYEDLITKWKVYSIKPQEYSFKNSLPPEIRQNFLDYLAAIEMLMIEKGKTNDTFATKLAELANFPLIFKPIADPVAIEAQAAQDVGAAQAALPMQGAYGEPQEAVQPEKGLEPPLPQAQAPVPPESEMSPRTFEYPQPEITNQI